MQHMTHEREYAAIYRQVRQMEVAAAIEGGRLKSWVIPLSDRILYHLAMETETTWAGQLHEFTDAEHFGGYEAYVRRLHRHQKINNLLE